MNRKQIQHGDVLLGKIDRLPVGVVEVDRKNGIIVVMDGEATGHRHTVKDRGAILYELKGDLYLGATEPITIHHDEHNPLTVPIGIYKIVQVKEYDYFQEMERNVID